MANNNPVLNESVFINDPEVIQALADYQTGKAIRDKGESMVNKARAILDKKLFSQNIRNAYTDDLQVIITEYNQNQFNTEEFIKYHKDLYDQYSTSVARKRYNIKKKIEVNIEE